MTQEEKELLRKDLCARLPYGVKAKVLNEDILRYDYSSEEGGFIKGIENINDGLFVIECKKDGYVLSYDEFKPYLLPLSSMTEEQLYKIKEITEFKYNHNTLELVKWTETHTTLEFWLEEVPQYSVIEVFDWLNKNHFDYRGLIPMGLAIDATNLNIYS